MVPMSFAAVRTTVVTVVKTVTMAAVKIIAVAASGASGTERVTRSAHGLVTGMPTVGVERMRCVADSTGGAVLGVMPVPMTGSGTTSMIG